MMRTVICIPASGSPFDAEDNMPEEKAEIEETIDVYKKPYQILFDGITKALKLMRAEQYSEARDCLMNAQIEADEAVTE